MVERWTVSGLTRYIRQRLDTDDALQDLMVEGEVSDLRVPGSGHAYFTLKDEGAQLRCVMWRAVLQAQTYLPQHGERILARGYVSVYEAGGQYQFYCHAFGPAGVGDLHAQFEALKAKLQMEGLFESARKRPLPALPRVIGVVTSPSAAALQDVLNVLRRRYPLAHVLLSPTAVQGVDAPPQIVAALDALNAQPEVDVILVVRGGGSLDDLWCFNDERVARAIAASRAPVVSGVGHETDFTLADFAADVRAPTPSAAAEIATPRFSDLAVRVHDRRSQLIQALDADLGRRRITVDRAARSLQFLSPIVQINNARQRIDALSERAASTLRHSLTLHRTRLSGLRQALAAVSPRATLRRGYAIVSRADGQVIRDAAQTAPGERIAVHLHRGSLHATVESPELAHE